MNRFSTRPLVFIVLAVSLAIPAARPARAEFAVPPDAPVERLIKNLGAYIQENPKDPQGYYTLARVHLLAFSLKSDVLRVFHADPKPGEEKKTLPTFSPTYPVGPPRADLPVPTDEQLTAHLTLAIENYRKAIDLDASNALFHLGLACVLEKGAAMAAKVGAIPGEPTAAVLPNEQVRQGEALVKKLGEASIDVREAATKELRAQGASVLSILLAHLKDDDAEIRQRCAGLLSDYWRERAIATYLQAYKLAIKKDLEIKTKPAEGIENLVSYEAGASYERLLEARTPTEAEKEQLAAIVKDRATLDTKPWGVVTPIIFVLDRAAPLDDLLAKNRRVKFDLDGTGRAQVWPWVKPGTGILVWDPTGTGHITSGKQLFGSVTFWMFWSDGYHALDALDDNRDGELSGDELRGLAVWFDRRGNGVCDPNDVVPIEKLGIKSISARATGYTAGSPMNSAGIKMHDGRILPTYDWVAERHK